MIAGRGRWEGKGKHSVVLQIRFVRQPPLSRGSSGIRRSFKCGADPHTILVDLI